jgi:hypothetical protein
MLFIRPEEYCNVIKIDDYNFFLCLDEGNVHGSLEGHSCIHQSKGHFSIHERAPGSREIRIFSILRKDRDLVIPGETIDHRHRGRTSHSLQNVLHFRQWVIILFGASVQIPEIGTQLDFPIILPHGHQISHPL